MKKIFVLFVAGILVCFSSCRKYLDVAPDAALDEDDVFSTYLGIRGYLDQCYLALNDIHDWQSQGAQRHSVNALSDEMGTLYQDNSSRIPFVLNTGNWLNQNCVELGWNSGASGANGFVISNSFNSLRVANKVIEKINDVPGVSAEQKKELLGQAYFFRAWYYFQIIQRWGGMPIFDKAYSPNDDLDLARLNYHTSNDWLITDLDKAYELLPHKWPDDQTGRATKVAALAVKEMAQLYDASPLMQNDINSISQKEYNVERAKLAAKYANEVLKYIASNPGGTNYRLMAGAEYENIFYTNPQFASDESLWYNMDAGRRDQQRGLRVHYIPQFFSGGTGNDAASFNPPTQNAVDMYEVINGGQAYPISDSRSGYNDQNPFANRDPRFYNNIIIPGEKWGVDKSNKQLYMEMYVGGRDYNLTLTNNQVNKRQTTGYVCKKFIWDEASTFAGQFNLNKVNTIYIRVAQIYLDYAEAMNEAYGPNADPEGYGLTAVQAINTIRNRVGMPNVLPEFTADKTTFRERIRNERAVELQFENHRWFDLRRWMIAENVFSKPIRGVRAMPKAANHGSVADKSTLQFNYNYIPITTEVRVFEKRHYWYPLPKNHVDDLYNLIQNPGW